VIEVRVEVRPPWAFRLPQRNGLDGLTRVRGGVLHRLLHAGDEPVLVRLAQLRSGAVLFGARARHHAAAEWAIARMRAALAIDVDLTFFHERFRSDPLIGPSEEVREVFEPYHPWAGLAGLHALRSGGVAMAPMAA
jgi:hypothetical protein